jgi:iron complex transport system substrate-binding protein
VRHSPTAIGALLAAIALIATGVVVFRGPRPAPPRVPGGSPLRVVSLAPSVTEMLFGLGVGDALVGVTDCCDWPSEAKRIECVGEFGRPNIEKLLAVSPDLVLAAGLPRNDLVRILSDHGIPLLDVSVRNIDEVLAAFQRVGQAVGRSERAAELVAGMQTELAGIAAEQDPMFCQQRPRVFVELGDNPLTTAGGTSFLDDLITRAGGVNVAHDVPQAYFQVSPEKVLEWNPDVIIVTEMTPGSDRIASVSGRIGWADVAAVKHGRIISDISADLLFRPGPRLVDAVKALARRLRETSPGSENHGSGG